MFRIQVKGQSGSPHWVSEKNLMLGSAPDCHLQLAGAEPHHARLISQNNRLFLRDNRSASGSYVNGKPATERELFAGDEVCLGEAGLIVLGPGDEAGQRGTGHQAIRWCLVSNSSWLAGQEFVIAPGLSTIGRARECQIVIPGSHLSRTHAEFDLTDDQLRITDLGSANGTFVNDQRIEARLPLRLQPGDRLRFDVYNFLLMGPGMTTGSTRLRDTLGQTQAPREKKPVDPKHWKTKPTSPGNREEPPSPSRAPLTALTLFVLLALAAGVYLYKIL